MAGAGARWAAVVLAVGGLLVAGRLPMVQSRISRDGTTYQTTAGALACLTADRYKRFIAYRQAKDDSLSAGMLDQGVCVRLRPGIEVRPIRRVGWWLDDYRLVQVLVISTRQTMVLDERLGLAALEPGTPQISRREGCCPSSPSRGAIRV